MIQYMLDLLHFTHCHNFPHGSNFHELLSKPHQAVSRLDNPSFLNLIVGALGFLKLDFKSTSNTFENKIYVYRIFTLLY